MMLSRSRGIPIENPLRLGVALPAELEPVCVVSPVTDGICGGGSIVVADVVSEDSGSIEAGVDARRSL